MKNWLLLAGLLGAGVIALQVLGGKGPTDPVDPPAAPQQPSPQPTCDPAPVYAPGTHRVGSMKGDC